MILAWCVMLLTLLSAVSRGQMPQADYHQHLFSPEAARLVLGSASPGLSARDLIALLDSAGIQRALVLSMAYTWGSANRPPPENEYERAKAENDWTAQQVAQYPDRLRAFCSVNPLKPYAPDEIARCSRNPQLRHGLKLHFGNSDVDLDDAAQVAQVRRVFETANRLRMPLAVHMRTSISKRRAYGAAQARVFIEHLLSAAPDVPVQIAHLAGAGGYSDAAVDSAVVVFIEAIARKDARMKNVWFDASTVARAGNSPEVSKLVADRIRQLGVERVLYGSDAPTGRNPPPRGGWAEFRKLPLTEQEFSVVANNVTPYVKW